MGRSSASPAPDPTKTFHTRKEVADRYRTTPATVAYWAHTGYLRGIRVGRRMLYPEKLLTEFEQLRANEAGTS